MDPRDIIPEEIWESVFARVGNPKDWLSLYRATPSFENVVGGKRVYILFPEVLPHLAPYLTQSDNRTGLLVLRSVCKKWKETVDSMLEAHMLQKSASFRRQHYVGYNFKNCAKIGKFFERFRSHPGNPFIGRCISLEYSSLTHEEFMEEFQQKVELLVDTFGCHVRRLRIVDICLPEGCSQFANRLKECILRVGNLTKLDISVFRSTDDCEEPVWNEVVSRELTEYFENNSLPQMPFLKTLTYSGYGGWAHGNAEEVQNALLKACCDPNSLSEVETHGVPMELSKFPNLQSLSTFFVDKHDLQKLPTFTWPLSLLSLNCHHGEILSIHDVFNGVQRFRGTLTSLSTRNAVIVAEGGDFRFDLPYLKNLEMDGISSLDFILNLGQLETLSVSNWKGSKERERTEVILTVGIEGEMDKSNIWELLPKLSRFKFKGTAFGMYGQPIQFDNIYRR